MSFLTKLFGSSSSTKVSLSHSPTQDPTLPKNPNSDSNMIRVFDAYGREMFITRQQWRDNVLLGTIQNNWDDPEKLAGFIIQSLQDNFFNEMIRPAERLLQLEPDAERSTVLLAIVYLKIKRLEDSENVLQQFISKRGESGVVLTNLAKVYAERGNEEKMLEILWRGLQLDPNQDNGLGWYEVTHLISKTAQWTTVLRLVCTTSGHCVGKLSESFNPADPAQAIKQLSYGLLELLGRAADVRQQTAPKNYLIPDGPYFPQYLLRLEQLLAVRCAATGNSQSGFLSGEREIIDGTLELVLDMPMSINIRLLLAQTLLAMKRVRPDILSEFSERILLLQKEKPLTKPAQGTLQRLFDEAFLA